MQLKFYQKILRINGIVMQSEKRGVKIDPTLAPRVKRTIRNSTLHACMLLGLLDIISVYNVLLQSYRNSFARAAQPNKVINYLHFNGCILHTVTQCVVTLCTCVRVFSRTGQCSFPTYSIFPDFPPLRERAGLIVLHK